MKVIRPLPEVTDHAVIRWLERVRGIDMEFFRRQLAEIVAPAVAIGASELSREGFVYVFDDNRVVTVVPRGWR